MVAAATSSRRAASLSQRRRDRLPHLWDNARQRAGAVPPVLSLARCSRLVRVFSAAGPPEIYHPLRTQSPTRISGPPSMTPFSYTSQRERAPVAAGYQTAGNVIDRALCPSKTPPKRLRDSLGPHQRAHRRQASGAARVAHPERLLRLSKPRKITALLRGCGANLWILTVARLVRSNTAGVRLAPVAWRMCMQDADVTACYVITLILRR
ncbi:uncharacterized protein B0H18DRAFT_954451 [Fomitopsis serialis]|uniref:uncharacterized protein n=1 Tax=Fomitopsis serialis TaxID=139415 RepID=UPI002008A1D2|nr:uncharacterized protein B0H18DRAFT_954451 [Neoantrodia serialis]KAH9927319.1 hypothetical protein B0H18DRAFT_954451 [Neoantrodia serialis]